MSMKYISFYLTVLFLLIVNQTPLKAFERESIKVIVFDFGSVIAKTDKQELIHFIANCLNISEKQAIDALKQLKEANKQEKTAKTFWADFAESQGIILPSDWQNKFDMAKLQSVKTIPGMIDLVKELQRQGYQTALLSNISKRHADIKRKLGHYDLFYPALFSYEIGARKPDIRAFEILLNNLRVPLETIIFIDNQQQNIDTAQSLGIDGIIFINKDQLIQELQDRGINVSFSCTQ